MLILLNILKGHDFMVEMHLKFFAITCGGEAKPEVKEFKTGMEKSLLWM